MPNPFDPDVPPEVYADPALGQVTSVALIRIDEEIASAPGRLYLVNHYAPGEMVRFEDWGDHLRVFINSDLIGMVKDATLVTLADRMLPGDALPLRTRVAALAQNFLAERLLLHSENEIGRVLFLESLFVADPSVRRVLEARDALPALRLASDALVELSVDFLTFHEMGHVGRTDERFAPYAEQTIAGLDGLDGFDHWKGDERTRIIEEVFSDVFAVNTLFARHAGRMCARTLQSYTEAVVTFIFRLQTLACLSLDLLRTNVDPEIDTSHLDAAILAMAHREIALRDYIRNFDFGPDTVTPADSDKYPELDLPDEVVEAVTAIDPMLSHLDPHARRMALLVSGGFASSEGFSAIVKACRKGEVVPRWY